MVEMIQYQLTMLREQIANLESELSESEKEGKSLSQYNYDLRSEVNTQALTSLGLQEKLQLSRRNFFISIVVGFCYLIGLVAITIENSRLHNEISQIRQVNTQLENMVKTVSTELAKKDLK